MNYYYKAEYLPHQVENIQQFGGQIWVDKLIEGVKGRRMKSAKRNMTLTPRDTGMQGLTLPHTFAFFVLSLFLMSSLCL